MADSAKQYAQGHTAASQTRHMSRNAENTCHYFTHLLKPTMHILDVGCGPGSITSSLARLVPAGHVTGIDQVESTLARARSQPDLPPNVTFQTGDAFALPFPDASFDVVHTSQLLCHLHDAPGALREFRRLLRPGGFVASREGAQDGIVMYPPHEGLDEWRRIQGAVMKGQGPNAGAMLVAWAMQAGFEESKCVFSAGSMTYTGREAWPFAQTMVVQTTEDEVFRRRILDSGAGDENSLREIREGWQNFAKDPACVFSVFCGQIVAYK